jgi:hypothetical protein
MPPKDHPCVPAEDEGLFLNASGCSKTVGHLFRFGVVLLLSLLFLSGCGQTENISFELASKPVYYREGGVRREPPVVHIRPVTEVGGLKVMFMPFRVVQKMDNPELAGYGLSRTFWQTWSAMRVFEHFEFMSEGGPFRRDLAVAQAKARGADMVIGGFVTHLMAGGNSGENRLALQLEGYDVSSGLMVWSMAQAGAVGAPEKRDFLVFEIKDKQSADPLHAITTSLARDMGEIMREWSSRGDSPEQSSSKNIWALMAP